MPRHRDDGGPRAGPAPAARCTRGAGSGRREPLCRQARGREALSRRQLRLPSGRIDVWAPRAAARQELRPGQLLRPALPRLVAAVRAGVGSPPAEARGPARRFHERDAGPRARHGFQRRWAPACRRGHLLVLLGVAARVRAPLHALGPDRLRVHAERGLAGGGVLPAATARRRPEGEWLPDGGLPRRRARRGRRMDARVARTLARVPRVGRLEAGRVPAVVGGRVPRARARGRSRSRRRGP